MEGQQDPARPSDGFLTDAIRSAFVASRYFVPMYLVSRIYRGLRLRHELTPEEANSPAFRRAHARVIDSYISIWLVLEGAITAALLMGFKFGGWGIALEALVLWRVFEIAQVTAGVYLFDSIGDRADLRVASAARLIVLAGINYLEIMTCFGVSYTLHLDSVHPANAGVGAGYYLSAMTQLTIGFGDVSPLGWLRLEAVMQGLVGFGFVILVFARIIAQFRKFTEVKLTISEDGSAPSPTREPSAEGAIRSGSRHSPG